MCSAYPSRCRHAAGAAWRKDVAGARGLPIEPAVPHGGCSALGGRSQINLRVGAGPNCVAMHWCSFSRCTPAEEVESEAKCKSGYVQVADGRYALCRWHPNGVPPPRHIPGRPKLIYAKSSAMFSWNRSKCAEGLRFACATQSPPPPPPSRGPVDALAFIERMQASACDQVVSISPPPHGHGFASIMGMLAICGNYLFRQGFAFRIDGPMGDYADGYRSLFQGESRCTASPAKTLGAANAECWRLATRTGIEPPDGIRSSQRGAEQEKITPHEWNGHLLSWLMRPSAPHAAQLQRKRAELGFDDAPLVVGVHIRRGDKAGEGAASASTSECMRMAVRLVHAWRGCATTSDGGQLTAPQCPRRGKAGAPALVFLASDSPAAIAEAPLALEGARREVESASATAQSLPFIRLVHAGAKESLLGDTKRGMHSALRTLPPSQRQQAAVEAALDIGLLAASDFFVGTCPSSIGDLVVHMLHARQSEAFGGMLHPAVHAARDFAACSRWYTRASEAGLWSGRISTNQIRTVRPLPPPKPGVVCPELCYGSACAPSGQRREAVDGTIWHAHSSGSTFDPSSCTACQCARRVWPVAMCSKIEIPTRVIYTSGGVGRLLGFGTRVLGMLVEAPGALLRGHGFQLSGIACPLETRGRAHCFFQPVTNCGSEVEHVGVGDHIVSQDEAQRQVVEACRKLDPTALCDQQLVAWRRVAAVLLRVQPDIQSQYIDPLLVPFRDLRSKTFGALHIRRTDKDIEIAQRGVCVYAGRLAALSGRRAGLSVFVATDDMAALRQLRSCTEPRTLGWSLVPFSDANPSRGEAGSVLFRLWAEITLLVEAAWVVGTFSSNTGRLVQVLRQQDEGTFASVDWPQERGRFPRAGTHRDLKYEIRSWSDLPRKNRIENRRSVNGTW